MNDASHLIHKCICITTNTIEELNQLIAQVLTDEHETIASISINNESKPYKAEFVLKY